MALTDADMHMIGMAVATLEAAVGNEAGVFRAVADEEGTTHSAVVGDGLVFALAMRGFVVIRDPVEAAEVAAVYERSPEQAARLQ